MENWNDAIELVDRNTASFKTSPREIESFSDGITANAELTGMTEEKQIECAIKLLMQNSHLPTKAYMQFTKEFDRRSVQQKQQN